MRLNERYRIKTKDIVFCGIATALMCALCPLALPVSGIPITLATLIIYIIAGIGKPLNSIICIFLYISAGCVGLPVLSGYTGGIAHIFGPSGGFILGYIPLVITVSLLNKSIDKYIIGMVAGTVLLYLCGYIGYTLNTNGSVERVFSVCILPFIPGDILKIVFASTITPKIKRIICKN